MYEKLDDIILKKRAIEKKLIEVLSRYYQKYFRKIYLNIQETNNANRYFQKELLYIGKWDNEKLYKEYRQFLKWCINKKNIEQNNLETWIKKYIIYSNKILLYPKKINLSLFESSDYTNITSKFFYKCLKKIAKHFYENPESFSLSQSHQDFISEYIKETIMFQLVSLLHIDEILLSDNQSDDLSIYSETPHEHLQENMKSELIHNGNNSDLDDNTLSYVPSEIFDIKDKESYHVSNKEEKSDDKKTNNSDKISTSSSDKDEKHIVLQMKPRYNDIMAITNANKQQKQYEYFSES